MTDSQSISQPHGMLDEREVARIIGMSIGSLRRWRLLNRGPRFIRVGGSHGGSAIRYRLSDIEAWLGSQPVGGSPIAPVESNPSAGSQARLEPRIRSRRGRHHDDWEGVLSALTDHHQKPDIEVARALYSAIAAHRFGGAPVWPMLVAPQAQ